MKKWLVSAIALIFALTGAVHAQDITGNWQGTLQAGSSLRIVFRVTKDAEGFTSTMHSIDQGGQAIATTITVQGSNVKISIPAIAGGYEGRLSADGNSMEGNWSQGPGKLPLNLVKATRETAWAIPEPAAPPKPMAADANPAFEVATIKPGQPGAQGYGFLIKGRQFFTINTSLSDLISFAYGVHARQISGGPSWSENDKYDIVGQPEGDGQPNERQWKIMVQKLLADRFRLAFHNEKRELPVYAIVVGKGGPKLTKSQGDPNGLPGIFFKGLGVMPAINANMGDLGRVLQGTVLDRPVIDQTGITGRYDFTLTWTPDEFQFPGIQRPPTPTGNPGAAPNLFTAIQEQLGLRLETTRAPADVIVIDRVEKPTDN
jgi:uncharacterized protein (TIGR03435 family)